MPYPPEPEYEGIAVAYNTLFTFQGRIMLASIVGFATGELLNAYSLQKIKEFQKKGIYQDAPAIALWLSYL